MNLQHLQTNSIYYWCQLNRLTLNLSKCKTMPLTHVQPYFHQGDIYYDVSTQEQFNSLQCLQTRGLKMLYGKKCKRELIQVI